MKNYRNDTYTQVHIHAVFAVKNRQSLILTSWKENLYKYIVTIIQNHCHKVLAIGGTADHIHILFGLRPSQSLSDLMREVKGGSSKWINEHRLSNGWFSWQEGYGAFSVSPSLMDRTTRYIFGQAEHHKTKTYHDEYCDTLKAYGIKYDERYAFGD